MKRRVKQVRDGNHAEIVLPLKARGIEVIETFRPLDCLIYNNGVAGWIEIKADSRTAHIQTTQIKFMAHTKMPVAFVKTVAEALDFAQTMQGLSQQQKDNQGVFLLTATKDKYHPAVVERVLGWTDTIEMVKECL